jgi:hypothetical protein
MESELKTKIALPVLKERIYSDPPLDSEIYEGLSEGAKKLPTAKFHVSYSELVDWLECSHRHKLKHIDKLEGDGGSEHTEFGSILHDAIEGWLKGTPFDFPKIHQDVLDGLKKYPKFKEDAEKWAESTKLILEELPVFLTKTFGDYNVISAELPLMEIIERKKDRYFKGFVDCFLEYTYYDRRKKDPEPEQRFLVADWKGSGWGWTGEKKRDPVKQKQLVLYKHYISKKFNIPLDKIKCAFILLKRQAKPGAHIEMIPVSVGEKPIQTALRDVLTMIGSMERGIALKNRSSCKYCVYAGTEHCT